MKQSFPVFAYGSMLPTVLVLLQHLQILAANTTQHSKGSLLVEMLAFQGVSQSLLEAGYRSMIPKRNSVVNARTREGSL